MFKDFFLTRNIQLQNKYVKDEKYSTENVVTNTVVTLYSDSW